MRYSIFRRRNVNFMLETKKLISKQKTQKSTKKITNERKPDISKFENYFNYKIPVKYVKPHQVGLSNTQSVSEILSTYSEVYTVTGNNYYMNSFVKMFHI